MGYTTEFEGQFTFDKPLDDATYTFLLNLSRTRRMKRNVSPEYGIEGEFYVEGSDIIEKKGFFGKRVPLDRNIMDYSKPPDTQPSLWCDWQPTEDRLNLEWNGVYTFYCYVEWLEYIITKIIAPRGYFLNGKVTWQGEEEYDKGEIVITNNEVLAKSYEI